MSRGDLVVVGHVGGRAVLCCVGSRAVLCCVVLMVAAVVSSVWVLCVLKQYWMVEGAAGMWLECHTPGPTSRAKLVLPDNLVTT